MALAPLRIRDLGPAGAIAVAPHLVVVRGPRGGLTLWRIAGDGIAVRFALAPPVATSSPEGA